MAKKAHLFNDFDTPNGSYNLFQNAMRKAIDYDANISDIFEAKVLTRPTLVTKQPSSVSFQATEGKTETFAFMARILGTNSPHRFLEDPCGIQDTKRVESRRKAFNLIQMHTKVFMQTDSQNSLPEIGDIVKLKLERGSYGSFKTDRAEFVKKEGEGDEEKDSVKECISIASAFKKSDFTTIGDLSDGEIDASKRYVGPNDNEVDRLYNLWLETSSVSFPEDQCGIPDTDFPLEKCKTGKIGNKTVTLHPQYFTIVEQAYNYVIGKNIDEKFYAGSSRRSPKQQIAIRIGNKKKNQNYTDENMIYQRSNNFYYPAAPLPKNSFKEGSRHLYGLAIDFGGILGSKDRDFAKNSKTFKALQEFANKKENKGKFKNYSAEPWHWSFDGR